ncbi:MAG: hypothetical protein A2504_06155 [Bdellovibrionales bacterium RIFOXYD12_FULL_39_22]|nr:MAG: hypothetical protein A2385_08475 [Bdellovibrionales bacterium RIFOXYB1_FULL_39_21]OFZ45262.1 MAG: hypothetical protein A2485_06060 [Bdellovibrionales bacterium RIFOXYC12_FULL_39_17]OFZ45548.1 MAG: hypothetical protein A2404_03055 [Bdellovibrionales bacterium RIFOXYC1_FULL_39_130]OFZ77409.1 MAG: hypothetical protein A2560_08645 [Bdellovibrionales bacterium RIFOXYD1_FULL_39_84]OFZ91538.1 MAG: hypothetical protein A2504_06155 [Bdellovibrionales bacterium RIFOXYD12_FULL_39_22]HLE12004.1 hy
MRKKQLVTIFLMAIFLLTFKAMAAPRYKGLLCGDDGKGCLFGVPTNQVVDWNLADNCQNAQGDITRIIENLKEWEKANKAEGIFRVVTKTLNKSKYTGYMKSFDDIRTAANGDYCMLEIHSEDPTVLLFSHYKTGEIWITTEEYNTACQDLYDQINADINVVDSIIGYDFTPTQGDLCGVHYLQISEK